MKTKMKNKWMVSSLLTAVTLLFTLMTVFLDVTPIGPMGTFIGLSHINEAVFGFFGVHMLWYTITDWLGLVAIFVAFVFGLVGLIQWILRKRFCKVDRGILVMGGFYLVIIAMYLLFEIFPLNYRPIIMPGCSAPEASFPSSHVMIVCSILGVAMLEWRELLKRHPLWTVCLQSVAIAVILVTVIGRLISGVHWFSDIIAGILFSATVVSWYWTLYKGRE